MGVQKTQWRGVAWVKEEHGLVLLLFFPFPHLLLLRLWLLDSLLPASSLPSLAAHLYLLPCPSGSIHPAAPLISASSTSLRRFQLSQPGFCLHPPGTTLPLALTVAIPCALVFIGELVCLIALGLLLSASHSETPFLDASC
ncbi:hypothetical protein G5714_014662 [Onychostoma macrolepis]|uniref:Uncharacterized protein n=1 Tax=Onychostoma macrolepis TaxID=369639 RepID=A0A7J6CE03_9TELE|nr:hypothetical protein G5714_014662 [Onychostoma macrolepis]